VAVIDAALAGAPSPPAAVVHVPGKV
jgi:hypothetical protein